MTDIQINETIAQFKKILAQHMPTDFGFQQVYFQKSGFGGGHIYISFAPSFQTIGVVKGQYPHRVSFWLNVNTLEFDTINLGSMGERSLQLTTQTGYVTDYHHVPFRKPKKSLINIYNAFDKF